MDNLEKLDTIAWEVGGEYDRDYSGRGMYGETCASIRCERGADKRIIEKAAAQGIEGARVDSLGMGLVVYWPRLKT